MMEKPFLYTQFRFAFKSFSIGVVLIVSFISSVFVGEIVSDRINYQEQVLEEQAGDPSKVLIHGKLPGFDENGISVYRLIDRVLKYAIIFISLTFLAFFLTEVFFKLNLHPLQYLLVGLGLAEFYLLLLALMEHIGFLWAYILAALMTILLISFYSRFVLKTKKGAFLIAAVLTIIYSYLLIALNMEIYALLSGAILLFIVLSAVMYITRNLDWYGAFDSTNGSA
jgi:inner membrane protein